jgi:hypothetical protein
LPTPRIEYDEVPDIEALVVIDIFPLADEDKDAEEDTEEQPEDEALERTDREALGLPVPVSNVDRVTSGDRDVDEQGVAVIDRADVGDKLELPELDRDTVDVTVPLAAGDNETSPDGVADTELHAVDVRELEKDEIADFDFPGELDIDGEPLAVEQREALADTVEDTVRE